MILRFHAPVLTLRDAQRHSWTCGHYRSVDRRRHRRCTLHVRSEFCLICLVLTLSIRWGYICQLIGSWSTKKIRRRQQVLSTWVFLFAFMLAIFGSSYAFGASGEANLSAGIATVVFVWLLNGGANFAAVSAAHLSLRILCADSALPQPVFYSMPAEILSFSTRAKG